MHIPTILVIFSTHTLFFPLTRPSSCITMIPFLVEKLRFCQFVGLYFSTFSLLFHIDYLKQESFLHKKENQGGDESRPFTLSWSCLHISFYFFSVIFLHTQQSTRSESQLVCFVLFLNYFFFLVPNQWHTPIRLPHLRWHTNGTQLFFFFIINFRFVRNPLRKGSKRLVDEVEKLKLNDQDTQWVSTFCAVSQSQIYLDYFLFLTPTVIGKTKKKRDLLC